MHPRTLKILSGMGVSARELDAAEHQRIHKITVNPNGFGLIGGTGAGKTWLMVQILANYVDAIVLASGSPEKAVVPYNCARWVNWPDVAETLKSWVARGFHGEIADLVETLQGTGMLFLDDLGQERVKDENDYSLGLLREVLDSRYREKRTVCWTSNLSVRALTVLYGARTLSRMLQAWPVIPIKGDDLRVKEAVS